MALAMLELVVQSPTVLFVQWDVPFAGEGDYVMRLYRLPDPNALPRFGTVCLELTLPQTAGSLYFHRLAPGHHYVVEIGVSQGGVFYPLRRSGVATTPRTGAAVGDTARVAAVMAPRPPIDWLVEGFGTASYYPGE